MVSSDRREPPSNHEGVLVDWIQEARLHGDALVIANPLPVENGQTPKHFRKDHRARIVTNSLGQVLDFCIGARGQHQRGAQRAQLHPNPCHKIKPARGFGKIEINHA